MFTVGSEAAPLNVEFLCFRVPPFSCGLYFPGVNTSLQTLLTLLDGGSCAFVDKLKPTKSAKMRKTR